MTNRAGEYVFPDGVGAATVQLKSPIVIDGGKVVKIDENNILGIISALLLIQKPALMYVLGFWMSTVRIPA